MPHSIPNLTSLAGSEILDLESEAIQRAEKILPQKLLFFVARCEDVLVELARLQEGQASQNVAGARPIIIQRSLSIQAAIVLLAQL